jgi:ectoine hydroxylase-related dioxygenase (phytanoyl-CoA dioxygenase family)
MFLNLIGGRNEMGRERLTAEQIMFYRKNGYLTGLPRAFDTAQTLELNRELEQLSQLLKPNEKLFNINGWHKTSKWLYDVCTNPLILDCVEDILGPDFFLWGSHFFAKAPGSADIVAWHQDAPYWPLEPNKSVTVWLAFSDSDEENGAMKVIPGTHKSGLINLKTSENSTNVLRKEMETNPFREEDAVSLMLKAGEFSLHDDAIVHGSGANRSTRWRTGLTIRYSSTDVKCDLSKWRNFTMYMVRGNDEYGHNPLGIVPAQPFGRPAS